MTTAEELRHETLAWLAARSALAFPAEAILRGLRRQGLDPSPEALSAALAFLTSAGFLSSRPDPLGSTPHYQITASGTLFHERSSLP